MARPSQAPQKEPHTMSYNTQQELLVIPEYGRNIQKLVAYACTVKNKAERNEIARTIVAIMGRINPHLRDPDSKQKLWDHLFIISDFKLDIDSPYPKPAKSVLASKPEKVEYPRGRIRFRHYGRAIERMIEKASKMKSGKEKEAFVNAIANLMKKSYLVWNRDTVNDAVILKELDELSDGKLKVSEDFIMANTNDILARTRGMNASITAPGGGGGGRNRGGRNRNHRNNRRNNRRRGRG